MGRTLAGSWAEGRRMRPITVDAVTATSVDELEPDVGVVQHGRLGR